MSKKSTRMQSEEIKNICDKRNAYLASEAAKRLKRENKRIAEIVKLEELIQTIKGKL